MRQPWLYFCYQFDASVVNSLTLWISNVSCHSVLSDDFKFYSDSVFHWRFIDKPWHGVFNNSIRQPWLYFCYWIHSLLVNSFTLSIPYVNCHSVFIEEFKVYSDYVFTDDLWISRDIVFLLFPCVNHSSSFAIDLMRWLWIHWRCPFHTSPVTQCSLTILGLQGQCFWWRFMDQQWHSVCQPWLYFSWRMESTAMTLFLLSIWCPFHKFIYAVDSVRQLSLSFKWWFQGL